MHIFPLRLSYKISVYLADIRPGNSKGANK